MNSLEKALIALRGAFQYADKHNIHVDNKHSIEQINKAFEEYRKDVDFVGYRVLANTINLKTNNKQNKLSKGEN